ncbi:MAG TPA: transglycosylase SLT domain-containing protein [Pyrinomonadaceae bacterium]|nr:transglycosylase SLT domain-containing protein [Pyrinomonadaceae bacterium]
MFPKFRHRRLVLILVGVALAVGASLPTFMTASCLTRPQTPAELKAVESLRISTRGGTLPSEDVVTRIESEFPRTKAASLARLVRARIRMNQKDFSGAATLLNSNIVSSHSHLGDYALFMRATALEQAGDAAGARAAYERVKHDYPTSLKAKEAALNAANFLVREGSQAGVPVWLADLASKDDGAALLMTARAYEQTGDSAKALRAYRRIYFYAPASAQSAEAATAIPRLGSSLSPATAEEAITRADKSFEAKRYADAWQAYNEASARFPGAVGVDAQLRRLIAAANLRKIPETVSALNSIPSSADARPEALFNLAQTYARVRQWEQARTTIEELRRSFPNSPFTPRAMVSVGTIAKEAKNEADASYFQRTAVSSYRDSIEVAQAQFDLAWKAHEAGNYADSSTQLTEHLGLYADRNTDNRGRAGYWAARDSERAGKLAEARALYQAVLGRYDANWYGYLAKQRLDTMLKNGTAPAKTFGKDSMVGRAVANLQTVTVAEETAGAKEIEAITKADELNNVGLDEWALEELNEAYASVGNSPKVNLAIARIHRWQENNVGALNVLKRSFPDYSQMKPEEMTEEEWDVFYPLAHWDIIVQESRAKNLDPYQVAGLIRQETVFMSRARSSARAYGLMQVLIPTAQLTARKYGVSRTITEDALYEPRLNVQIGTAYLRDQIDKFGRIEYVAAAYNAGPMRMVQWRSIPGEIDQWAEAVPFKETRGYIQGVVRNRLQYQRLYDEQGQFRRSVGSRAVTKQKAVSDRSPGPTDDPSIHKERLSGNESGG